MLAVAGSAVAVVTLAVLLVLPPPARNSQLPVPPQKGFPPNIQELFQAGIRRDEKVLDRGALTYPRPTLHTSVPVMFTITVTDIGKKQPLRTIGVTATQMSDGLGLTVYPRDVPTGGGVSLWASYCGDITCSPLNVTPLQDIVGRGTQRSWRLGADP